MKFSNRRTKSVGSRTIHLDESRKPVSLPRARDDSTYFFIYTQNCGCWNDVTAQGRLETSDCNNAEIVTLSDLSDHETLSTVIVSPWDSRTPVPSFENEAENFVRMVVVESGDRVALENGSVLAALTAKI